VIGIGFWDWGKKKPKKNGIFDPSGKFSSKPTA